MHPEIQEKIVKELLEVCDKDNMNLDHLTLSKLKYMEFCLKETMRLFPVLPYIGRKSGEEIEIGNFKSSRFLKRFYANSASSSL